MVARKSAQDETVTAEVVVKKDWSSVTTWESATTQFQYIADSNDAFGDGVRLVDKSKLIGVEFLVLEMKEVQDKKSFKSYWNILVILRNGNKACFNDGSTGVAKQAEEWIARTGQTGGIYCEKGLRLSEYMVEIDGKSELAKTYYFA